MTNVSSSNQQFLAFASDEKDVSTLKDFAASQGWLQDCVNQGTIAQAVAYLRNNPSPPVLLVEINSSKDAPAELDLLAAVCAPSTKVIVTGTVNEYSFFCWLMGLGISSYLLKPLTVETLKTAWEKAQASEAPVSAQAKKSGTIISVIGTRGGVGATTLAINLAGIIAEKAKKKVALIDLDAREGSIALALDLEPGRGFKEALEKPDRIDSLFLERVMSKPNPNLSILSAEESIQEHLKIHDGAADTLLKELKAAYDVIVLDIPRHLDVFSTKCLGSADHVVLVTELTLISLRDALRFQDLMREKLKMKTPIVVAMRTGLAPKQQVVQADFEKGINLKVSYSVPFAPDIFMPVDLQIAAMKHRKQPATKPLHDLAGELVPEAKEVNNEKKVEKKGGLLGKKK